MPKNDEQKTKPESGSAIERMAAQHGQAPLTPSESIMARAAAPTPVEAALNTMRERLDHYLEHMAPGTPVDAATGAQFQQRLWTLLQWILNRPPNEFNAVWGGFLDVVSTHRQGAFSELYVNRFGAYFRPETQLRNFERVLHLALTTCDRSTRQFTRRQVDLARLMSGFTDHTIVQRLEAFYSV